MSLNTSQHVYYTVNNGHVSKTQPHQRDFELKALKPRYFKMDDVPYLAPIPA